MDHQIARPTKPFHQMVWIDHHKATIYGVTHNGFSELAVIHEHDQGWGHVHHRAGTPGPGHTALSQTFLLRVTVALVHAREILIVGPGNAKLALKSFIALNAPLLNKRILGVEPMDKCAQGEMQAFANHFFRQADRMLP